jgi:hypothetical protein
MGGPVLRETVGTGRGEASEIWRNHVKPPWFDSFKMSQAVDPSEEVNLCLSSADRCGILWGCGASADRKFREDEIKAPNLHVGGAENREVIAALARLEEEGSRI